MRTVILHSHLFKNAGSTVDWVLKNNFQSDFLDHREDKLMDKDGNYLKSLLVDNKNIKSLSSHTLPCELPRIPGVKIIRLQLLRHPLDRSFSVYSFLKKEKTDQPSVVAARKYNFRDFVDWNLHEEGMNIIKNFQVRRSSGVVNPNDRLDISSLDKAIAALEKNTCVGIVEEFRRTACYFENQIVKAYPGFSFRYERKNISQHNTPLCETIEGRLEVIKTAIGDKLFEQLAGQNQMDYKLWKYFLSKLVAETKNMSVVDKEIYPISMIKKLFTKIPQNIFSSLNPHKMYD